MRPNGTWSLKNYNLGNYDSSENLELTESSESQKVFDTDTVF